MSKVSSNTFLSTLIQTGSDASLNLFVAHFRPTSLTLYDKEISCRINSVTELVPRNSVTTSLPYQNVNVDILSSGTSITKTSSIVVRLDSDYSILDKLRSYQCIDNYGKFVKDVNKKFDIIVEALSPKSGYSNNFESVYKWVFSNCYLTNLSSLTYNYDSSGNATITVTFVWEHYTEGKCNSEGELNLISGQDITNHIFDELTNLIQS